MNTKINNIIALIVCTGLLIVPVLPLVVTRSLFFPFITGRNFIFRIIVEILFALWVWLMLSDPKYRPQTSSIFYSIICLVCVLFLATVFSVSPYKSFWSSFERMEGFWQYWHYFLYFIILAGMFKEKKDWFRMAFVSIGASLIVSIYAVLQVLGKLDIHQGNDRLDSTMGNATYLAIYLVFHIFLLVYVSIQLKASKIWIRLIPLALALFELFIVYKTATRGALLGFLAGIFVFGFINAVWSKGLVRKISVAVLGVSVLIPIIFFLVRDSNFVRNSETLSRFASISLNETTTQSRFIIWNMAYQAWKDRPVLGWGPESFIYVFSRFYDPQLWRQEPWFDRAHNVFLDWLVSSGIVGLLSYLAIFGASLVIIYKLFRSEVFNIQEAGCFVGFLVAYFVNNIFVFDSFNSYMPFFALVAYWHFVYKSQKAVPEPESSNFLYTFPKNIKIGVTAIVAFTTLYSLFFFNVRPILAAQSIISSMRASTYSNSDPNHVRDLDEGMNILKKAIGYNTFGTIEIREQLAQYATKIGQDSATSGEDKRMFFGFAIDEMKKQAASFPYNVRAKAFLSTLYGDSGNYQESIAVAKEGLAISPNRQQFWFLLAEAYFKAGEGSLAIDAMKTAYELAPDYPGAIHNYAMVLIFSGHPSEAEALLKKHFGVEIYPDPKYVNAYAAVGDFKKLTIVWEKLVEKNPDNWQYRLSLASAYIKTYRDQEAIKQIEKAIELNSGFKAQGEVFIKQIREGKLQR